jgi:hypothetical protein
MLGFLGLGLIFTPGWFLYVAIMLILGLMFPRAMKYGLTAPLIGIGVGGFSWSVAAFFNMYSTVLTLHSFEAHIVLCIIIAECLMFSAD